MACRSGPYEASQHPGRPLVYRAATPWLVYRIAAWRPPAAIADGRLIVRRQGPGCVHLHYRGPNGDGRAGCLRRQAWILGVPASCGTSRTTLREESCLADGDPACRYVVTWAGTARAVPAAVVGVLASDVVSSMGLPFETWALVAVLIVALYALERRRVAQTNRVAIAQSGTAFRALIGPALAHPDTVSTREPTGAPASAPRTVTVERDGDMWRVVYGATMLHIRHSRGLALLAHLVRNPRVEIHVRTLDAITPSGGSPNARVGPAADGAVIVSGDAGEVLDAKARSEYRRRIMELRDTLEDAQACADLGRADAMRAELELLEDELRRAVGPNGRARRAADDAERLRVAITHRVRAAIAQIARCDSTVGEHLRASVSTGYRCVYQPADPAVPDEPAVRQPAHKA